jgi:hypothetical protein
MTETKICTKCGNEKELDEFPKCSYQTKDGTNKPAGHCKTCRAAYHRTWYAANRESVIRRSIKYRKGHPKQRRKSLQDWRNRKRFLVALQSSRSAALKLGHEPCISTADEIKASFSGYCAVCGVSEEMCTTRLHMDHNHVTGNFRGWLCPRCNKILGMAKDSADLLIRLATYAGT